MRQSLTFAPIAGIVSQLLDCAPEFSGRRMPLSVSFEPGHPASRVLIVAGDSAAGRKVAARLIAGLLERESARGRAAWPYPDEMPAVEAQAILEGQDSQMVSVKPLKMATHIFDAGVGLSWVMAEMSEEDSAECDKEGTGLAQFGAALPTPHCQGLVVVTNSALIVSSMLFSLNQTPHFLCFAPRRSEDLVQDWLDDQEQQSVQLSGVLARIGERDGKSPSSRASAQ